MDFSLVFLVALALTGAVNVNAGPIKQSTELHKVFEEFLALVPQDKFAEIVHDYFANDPEVQAAVEYISSEGFKDLVRKVESIEDVINFYDELEKAGLNVYSVVNSIHEAIGLPPLVPGGHVRNARRTGGVAGLVADLKAILPIEDIKALYHEKLETSAVFAKLVSHFQSPRFQQLINALRANQEFQKILKFAKEHGIDVQAVTDLLATMFGLEFPSSRAAARSTELHQVFEEFLDLVPRESVDIVQDYLANDAEVQAVAKYIASEGFKDLVRKVESIEDVINFYDYLEKAGLDVYLAVNAIHEAIGLPPLVPGGQVKNARNVRRTGGVAGLIADLKAILPIEDIKALYHEKLETSAAFAELVSHFQSPRFQQLINALRDNQEFQKILKFAKEHGIDVKAITDLLSTMLGLEFPTSRAATSSELNEVLAEFMALVPTDEISEILMDYASNDKEFQLVVKYVTSEDFKVLVKKVESIQDVINFYDYLDKAGLDIYGAVNAIHEVVGLPPLVPGSLVRNARRTGGVSGFIADVKAILPIAEIKALYHEKLETSPAFAELVSHFQSPRFQQLINALRANQEFQKIVKFAKEHGVDVKAVVDLLSTMLGLEFPSSRAAARSTELHEVFEEFMALIPQDEFIAIVQDYAENDAEVKAAYEYIGSEGFKDLVRKVESIKDVINFYDYLEKAGLDVYLAVNAIHEAIGLPPLVPGGLVRTARRTGGMAGLVVDIKAILPLEDIKALYHKKLETSAAFAELVSHFQSPRFQELINALRANQEFQKILKFAKEHGIDVKAITDLLSTLLGLEFPTSRAAARSTELHEVFEEFMALIPQDEFIAIVQDYAQNDAEVKAAYEYIGSEGFKDLVRRVESIKDVINFYDYLEKAGLDVYLAVNAIHEAIGLPPLVPGGLVRTARRTGGMAGLVVDIKAILPLEDIKALYHEKLETSAAFAELVSHFQSPRFQELINALRANQEFQKILKFAKEHGIDVKAIADLLSTLLGLEFPEVRVARGSSQLDADFQEFFNLMSPEDLLELAGAYAKDPAVQAANRFMFSEEFKSLLLKGESLKDVIDFFDYLEESGVSIYHGINNLHSFLGLPPIVHGRFARTMQVTGGIDGYYADFKALIPTDKVQALREKKLKTSTAYAKFDKNVRSPRFLQLVGNLRANKEFQAILEASKAGGLDFRATADILFTMVGLQFPTIPNRIRLPGY